MFDSNIKSRWFHSFRLILCIQLPKTEFYASSHLEFEFSVGELCWESNGLHFDVFEYLITTTDRKDLLDLDWCKGQCPAGSSPEGRGGGAGAFPSISGNLIFWGKRGHNDTKIQMQYKNFVEEKARYVATYFEIEMGHLVE